MAKPTTSPIVISQQSLNLVRQIVAAQGWAKSISDMYVGGKLLAETLPQLETLSWVVSQEEMAALSKKDREVYLAKDKAWVEKPCEFAVTTVERDTVERAFQHFVATAASAKQLGPNPYLLEAIEAFKVKDAPVAPEPAKGA